MAKGFTTQFNQKKNRSSCFSMTEIKNESSVKLIETTKSIFPTINSKSSISSGSINNSQNKTFDHRRSQNDYFTSDQYESNNGDIEHLMGKGFQNWSVIKPMSYEKSLALSGSKKIL